MKVQRFFRLSHTFFDAVAVRDDSGIEVMMYRGKPSEVVGANVCEALLHSMAVSGRTDGTLHTVRIVVQDMSCHEVSIALGQQRFTHVERVVKRCGDALAWESRSFGGPLAMDEVDHCTGQVRRFHQHILCVCMLTHVVCVRGVFRACGGVSHGRWSPPEPIKVVKVRALR